MAHIVGGIIGGEAKQISDQQRWLPEGLNPKQPEAV